MGEVFVDPSRFTGTCYQSANWIEVGYIAGRRDGIKKKIFLYPMRQKWQEVLCAEPPIRIGMVPRIQAQANWAEQEFGSICLYDDRLKRRLYKIAQVFYTVPEANIPQACGSKAGTMGGHLGRKGDGFPCTQTLWRGLQRLDTATEMDCIFTHQQDPNPMQSGPFPPLCQVWVKISAGGGEF
jgi:hypothetical protein